MCGVQKLLLMLKAISCNFLCNLGIYYQIIYGKQNIYLFIFFFFFFYYIWLNQCFISYNFQPLKYFSKLQHSKSIYCTQSNLHKKIISKGTYFIIKSCFKLSISQKKLKNSTQFYLQKQQQQISSYQKQIICHNSPLQCGQQEPQENEKNKKSGPENTNRNKSFVTIVPCNVVNRNPKKMKKIKNLDLKILIEHSNYLSARKN
eukprot:TRINITY_DN10861_c0_g1_i1.p1 TRINITY_DN10861_c0_g1~~TRINITY_DN10861_c0_g1_i1.p1  ORF type:complete len:211 (+),score=-18.77 TRINITY_DN10861_c0_g1_i1:26-634(+)